MRPILYLGDTFCVKVDELKDILAKSPSQDSAIGKEILCALKDGLLKEWLESGNQEEQHIALRLPQSSHGISDSEIMRRLGECFKAEYKTRRLALSDYIVLESVKGCVGSEAFKSCSLKGYSLTPPKDQNSKVRFRFHFKTEKAIGENVTFKLCLVSDARTSAISNKNMLDLRDIGKSIDLDLNLLLPLNLSKTRRDRIKLIAEFMNTEIVLWECSISSGQTFKIGNVEFEMIGVEGGTFWMGAQSDHPYGRNYDSEASGAESPVHQVTLSDYSIGEYPVTQRLWKEVMGINPSNFIGNSERPVENVCWNEITNDFLPKLNNLLKGQLNGRHFILPSEAQWEYAARGGNKSKGYKYSGSNNINEVAWFGDNIRNTTLPVGQKKPNELGLYDMSGDVAELCEDGFGNYSKTSQKDPVGSTSRRYYRVLRGGNWDYEAWGCRVTSRISYFPDGRGRSSRVGFRLALSSAF